MYPNLERLELTSGMRGENPVPQEKDKIELPRLVKVTLHLSVPIMLYAIQLLQLPSRVEKEFVADLHSSDDSDAVLDLSAKVQSQLPTCGDALCLDNLEFNTTHGKSLAEVTWSRTHTPQIDDETIVHSCRDAPCELSLRLCDTGRSHSHSQTIGKVIERLDLTRIRALKLTVGHDNKCRAIWGSTLASAERVKTLKFDNACFVDVLFYLLYEGAFLTPPRILMPALSGLEFCDVSFQDFSTKESYIPQLIEFLLRRRGLGKKILHFFEHVRLHARRKKGPGQRKRFVRGSYLVITLGRWLMLEQQKRWLCYG